MTRGKKPIMYTKFIGKQKVRIWSSIKSAQKDLDALRRKGYKVKIGADKSVVVVIGKLTRGYAKTRLGRRAMLSQTMRRPSRIPGLPRLKPDDDFFRQPSFTLRKFGWAN